MTLRSWPRLESWWRAEIIATSPGTAPVRAAASPPKAIPDPPSGAPAILFFTSGSTGAPKGVVHTQASVLAMLTSTSEALDSVRPSDVVQVFEPLVHVSGIIATFTTLMAGGTVTLYEGFDIERYVAALIEYRPTFACTHIDVLGKSFAHPERGATVSSLRGAYTGGETVRGPLQMEFSDIAGLPIGVGWGMTEAIWLTVDASPDLTGTAA